MTTTKWLLPAESSSIGDVMDTFSGKGISVIVLTIDTVESTKIRLSFLPIPYILLFMTKILHPFAAAIWVTADPVGIVNVLFSTLLIEVYSEVFPGSPPNRFSSLVPYPYNFPPMRIRVWPNPVEIACIVPVTPAGRALSTNTLVFLPVVYILLFLAMTLVSPPQETWVTVPDAPTGKLMGVNSVMTRGSFVKPIRPSKWLRPVP